MEIFLAVNNNNINEVITNLYKALVLVRYPGIAQIDLSNLENTVLAENNRIPLLHWLLVQSINVVDSSLDIPTADETSLIKWYSQFGLCTNKNELLGQCSLTQQLDTLVNLTKFIMNVLGSDGNEASVIINSERNILFDYTDNEINIFPLSSDLPFCNLTYKEAQQYINKKNKNLKDQENNIRVEIKDYSDNSVADNGAINNDLKVDNRLNTSSDVCEEFCEVFRSVEMHKNSERQNTKENKKSMDNCIGNIHPKFSTFNETLRCKKQISNIIIPTELNVDESPLNQVIQETVIGFEQLSKLHGPDNEER